MRRLMRLVGLEAIYQAPRTSTPHQKHRIFPYLPLGLMVDRPKQVWCAAMTFNVVDLVNKLEAEVHAGHLVRPIAFLFWRDRRPQFDDGFAILDERRS